MLLALSPKASTASSACPGPGSGGGVSTKRTLCRSSRATRKSIRAEGILPAPSGGGEALGSREHRPPGETSSTEEEPQSAPATYALDVPLRRHARPCRAAGGG